MTFGPDFWAPKPRPRPSIEYPCGCVLRSDGYELIMDFCDPHRVAWGRLEDEADRRRGERA